jgi:hypothetical protein
MKKLFFILIPVAFANAGAVAEKFKSKEFNSIGEIPEAVNKELVQEDETQEDDEVLVMSVSAFTDFYNGDVGAAVGYFIAPVFV